MKIYTKTGDAGETGLFGGPRVAKDHARIEAYGCVDELNSALGVTRAQTVPPTIDALLARIQHNLFSVGAELATPDPASRGTDFIADENILVLESAIDDHEADLPPLKSFILPGGTIAAANLHFARTLCRRAERRVVALAHVENISPEIIRYLNRLSDLLFVLARWSNHHAGHPDVPWKKPDEKA